jgi:mono/diheme cytochrome c family protein
MAKPEPGRDPQMVARTQKLNVVFALSSIALFLGLSWMIWADYNREWKKFQLQFNKLEVSVTQKQIEEALGKVDAAKRKALEAAIAKGREEERARYAEIKKAEAEHGKLQARWYAVDQNFRFTKAHIDVVRFQYEEALHKESSSAPSLLKKLRGLEDQWRAYRLDLEKVIAERDAAQAKLNELEKTRLAAQKEQQELFTQKDRLEEKLRKIQPGFVSFARNLPILDLANPSLKVNQVITANLQDDVIFSGTPKIDRCTTCHLGIDKKGYESAPQPFTTHPDFELYLQGPHPVERVGCTVCHQGRGRATGFVSAVHTPSTKEQEKAWGKYSKSHEYERWHYWDFPMMAKGTTESQCLKCHQGVIEVPRAERLNAGVMLLERYGCYGCHKIKGWESIRKPAPDLKEIASKTNEEWVYRWVKEPQAFRKTRMPQVWDVRIDETAEQKARNDAEANAVVAYVIAKSGKRDYPTPPAGDLVAGRKLFETVGCLGCHRVGDDKRGVTGLDASNFRAHGPHLDGTGSKVSAGWLYAWVRDPKGYWHETRMPNLRLSEKEAADITAYLMSLRNEEFTARTRPALDKSVRDDIILNQYLEGQYSVADAKLQLDAMPDEKRTLFLGEKTIGRYGCFGCHNIPGFEKTSPIGVELTEEGSKLVERLDFGYEHGKIPHTLPGWVHRKLMEPRVFDVDKAKRPEELLRMPKYHFTDEEADAIVTAVMSLTKEQVPLAAQRQLSAEERVVEKGRRLVRQWNCQACHQIGEKGGTIRAVVEDQLESSGGDVLQAQALSPPMLYNAKSKMGEGARVHTDWLHNFLDDPSDKIRPWLALRMPTFQFTEEELNAITHYFAAQDRVPYPYEPRPVVQPAMVAVGQELFNKWQCVKCHVVAGKLPNQEPANMAPDLANVPKRLRADWLPHWLADPLRIQPGTRMPANFPADPAENAYPDILGGDQKQQIEAVRAYLLTLGKGGATPTRSAGMD